MKNTARHPLWSVSAALLFWTAIGLVFALPTLAGQQAWRPLLLSSLARWWAWGLLAPLVIALDRRLPFNSAQSAQRLLSHLALGLLTSLACVYLRALLAALLQVDPWRLLLDFGLLAETAREGMAWSMLVYSMIVGGWWAYQYQQRYLAAELRMARIERSYTEARLTTLRLQLDPHFLFNTLNTISAQVQADPRLARQMIEQLGDLLRLSLDPKSRHEVTLEEELALLDRYLSIQKIRFGDKLRVTLAIAAEVRQAAVPSMFLQPLVENAIRHGISRRAAGGAIVIAAQRRDGMLEIRVSDDGVGLPPGWPQHGQPAQAHGGLGLQLTRERIAAAHPDGATCFDVRNRVDGGVEVTIRLPLRQMSVATEAGHVPA
jgi:two-component sensor histidine kinase